MKKIILAIVLIAVVAVGAKYIYTSNTSQLAQVANAQSGTTLTVTPNPVMQGRSISFSVSGTIPFNAYTVSITPTIGTEKVILTIPRFSRAVSSFTGGSATIPTTLTSGAYIVKFTGTDGAGKVLTTATAAITVGAGAPNVFVPPPTAPSPTPIPPTPPIAVDDLKVVLDKTELENGAQSLGFRANAPVAITRISHVITNSSGVVITTNSTVSLTGGTAIVNLLLPRDLAVGTYTLKVTANGNLPATVQFKILAPNQTPPPQVPSVTVESPNGGTFSIGGGFVTYRVAYVAPQGGYLRIYLDGPTRHMLMQTTVPAANSYTGVSVSVPARASFMNEVNPFAPGTYKVRAVLYNGMPCQTSGCSTQGVRELANDTSDKDIIIQSVVLAPTASFTGAYSSLIKWSDAGSTVRKTVVLEYKPAAGGQAIQMNPDTAASHATGYIYYFTPENLTPNTEYKMVVKSGDSVSQPLVVKTIASSPVTPTPTNTTPTIFTDRTSARYGDVIRVNLTNTPTGDIRPGNAQRVTYRVYLVSPTGTQYFVGGGAYYKSQYQKHFYADLKINDANIVSGAYKLRVKYTKEVATQSATDLITVTSEKNIQITR